MITFDVNRIDGRACRGQSKGNKMCVSREVDIIN